MSPKVINAIIRRLGNLEQRSVRYRQGVITSTSPLSVAVGGSDTSHAGVRALAVNSLAVGDTVALLMFGHDALILGRIGSGKTAPRARVYNSAAQSRASGSALTFDSERYDHDGAGGSTCHDTGSNTSRLTVPAGQGGVYSIGGVAFFNFTGGTDRWLGIRVNGSVFVNLLRVAPTSNNTILTLGTEYELEADDYVELVVGHDAGGSQSIGIAPSSTVQYVCEFWFSRVGQ